MAPAHQLTVLYLTDNSLEPWLMELCQRWLLKSIGDLPLVSVSQKPIDFGRNICVGELGRSGLNMCRQTMAGLEVIDTPFVAIAEHDCIYGTEHFQFIPPDRDNFYFNDNVWFLQTENPRVPEFNGMYSQIGGRRAQSQMTCGTQILREATEQRIGILSEPAWIAKIPSGRIGEPGGVNREKMMRVARGDSVRHVRRMIEDYINKWAAKDWKSLIPNIDIRHRNNFTGARRGNRRRWELEPWGRMEDVLHA